MMEYITRNMMIFFKSIYYFLRAISIQVIVALIIYSIGLLVSSSGIISSFVAVFPLALILGMTITGQFILFYLFLVLPIFYIVMSFKVAHLDWILKSVDKIGVLSLLEELISLEEIRADKSKLESFIESDKNVFQLNKAIGYSDFLKVIKSSSAMGVHELKTDLVDFLNDKKLKLLRFIKGAALLHGGLIAIGLLLFILK